MTTFERLREIILKNYPLQREMLSPEARLEDLQIDSLGLMELFFGIEDEFHIKVPNDRQDLKTIGDVANYIDRLVLEQQGSQPAAGGLS